MATELIINATLPETRIALLEHGEIQELHIERDSERGIVGNIYKGKVIRVLPGMQAAFVDIGLEKAAFLYVDDIFFPDMKTPLMTHPLPEMLPKPATVVVPPASTSVGPAVADAIDRVPAVRPAPVTLPVTGKDARGRGGRGRQPRGADAGTVKPGQQPIPGSPEEHDMMQREYARQMLQAESDPDAEVPVPPPPYIPNQDASGVPVVPAPVQPTLKGPTPNVVPAGANPTDFATQAGQPEARAPQGADAGATEFDDDEDDLESEAVYRPEPLIDTAAWAEDLASQEHEDSEEGEGEAPTAVESQNAVVSADLSAKEGEAGAEAAGGEPEEVAASDSEEGQPASSADAIGVVPSPKVTVGSPTRRVVVLPTPLASPVAVAAPQVGGNDAEDDDDDVAEMPRRRRRREPVNIADIIKEGQEIIVQVAKDPIGTKGARLTCHVSLPGRYLVFMPTVDHIGVSRRIESEGERRRLKETMGKIRPAKTGVIVRTASGKQTDKKLKQDLDYLVTTWNDIQKKFLKQRTPSAVYQDLTIVLRAIRDMFTDEVDKVVVDSKTQHKAIMRFVTRFIPQVKDKVELYPGDMPIFDYYGIETEISKALERKVWLKSGGYLVVDQAEALVAIDVNTGRYVGKKTLEETILKTNLEAVKEIAYQLRIRNCGGIIILDLIDMEKEGNKEKVYKALDEALKKDRARPSILKISSLGLIEMTRKRTRDSMVRSLCEACTYCEGKGFVKNKLTITYDIMRDLEREGVVRDTQAISIQCHPSVADVLLEDKRDVIEALEHQFNKKITIRGNGAYHVEQYELVAHRENKNIVWSSEERRQMLRQKINERMQSITAEHRKNADAERQEKKREADDKRKEQDRLRLERKTQGEERRRAAAAARAAALAARGIDPSSPEASAVVGALDEEVLPTPLPLPEFDESQPFVNVDGTPMTPEQIGELRASHAAMVAALVAERAAAQAAQPRRDSPRRRRGRRGRSGGGRGEGRGLPKGQRQAHGGQAPGVARPRGPLPLPRPIGSEAGPAGVESLPVPRTDNLGPREHTGSGGDADGDDYEGGDVAHGGEGGEGQQSSGVGVGAGTGTGPDAGEQGPRRRRRRGRRGGRRRRRFGQPGAPGEAGGGAEGGGLPGSGGSGGSYREGSLVASPSGGSGGEGGGAGGGSGSDSE